MKLPRENKTGDEKLLRFFQIFLCLKEKKFLYLHSPKKRTEFSSGCAVIGSHARLRIWCREAWGFESLHPHQILVGTCSHCPPLRWDVLRRVAASAQPLSRNRPISANRTCRGASRRPGAAKSRVPRPPCATKDCACRKQPPRGIRA